MARFDGVDAQCRDQHRLVLHQQRPSLVPDLSQLILQSAKKGGAHAPIPTASKIRAVWMNAATLPMAELKSN